MTTNESQPEMPAGEHDDGATEAVPRGGVLARREAPPQIQGYEIIRELHRGGQGVVYEALQRSAKVGLRHASIVNGCLLASCAAQDRPGARLADPPGEHLQLGPPDIGWRFIVAPGRRSGQEAACRAVLVLIFLRYVAWALL
jgi:hypothetical protein